MSEANWFPYASQFPPIKRTGGGSGYVYILENEYSEFKIGETVNPVRRFTRLQKQYQFQWRVVDIFPSEHCWNQERALHSYFRPKRVAYTQDWFHLTVDDILFIGEFVASGQLAVQS
jgi:predicted GIY-YIG superfamily endonuclease